MVEAQSHFNVTIHFLIFCICAWEWCAHTLSQSRLTIPSIEETFASLVEKKRHCHGQCHDILSRIHSQKRNIGHPLTTQIRPKKIKNIKRRFLLKKSSWGTSASKLKLLAVQWLSSYLSKVGSYVAIGVIQSKVAVSNHP